MSPFLTLVAEARDAALLAVQTLRGSTDPVDMLALTQEEFYSARLASDEVMSAWPKWSRLIPPAPSPEPEPEPEPEGSA